MGRDGYLPLFETKVAKGRILFRCYAASMFVGIIFIWVYRVVHFPPAGAQVLRRWAWMGLFLSELLFSFYWFLTQLVRWSPIYRYTFKDRLSQRYEEVLPGIDIFVCTADPRIEPPIMVINTVLSVMAYSYPSQNLSVYLSDDGGSDLTFYALLEASRFSKHWLPFCRKFSIEPRSPAAYFSTTSEPPDSNPLMAQEWLSIKELYEEMKNRIETTTRLSRISEEIRKEDKGFLEWNSASTRHDHQSIVQIVIDGRDPKAVDSEGQPLPTLVYLSREKRPQYHHNFKAGAMNALIRVSSKISNGSIILNVDCDMYSNNSESVRDAVCFFMDEEKGHEIAYVQFPQCYDNLTRNDLYGTCFRVIIEVEFPGLDSNGGPFYIGTGCFHRRVALCGMKYDKECEREWKKENGRRGRESASVLEESCKVLASCTYEENSQWGKEMGVKYDCAVEDVITGFSIQCRGWKSVYVNPERKGFLGVAPTTLLQSLVQHKRWSEGHLQMFLSRHCPLIYGHKKVPLKLQLAYSIYNLWAAYSLAMLCYAAVPSLCLLGGISLFPEIWSLWVLPFAYVIIAKHAYSLGEFHWYGGTIQGWWNDQRIWMFRRTTSYFFGFLDTILRILGFAETTFAVTGKATLALLNLFSFVCGVKRVVVDIQIKPLESLALQIILCGVLVLINLPVYQGLFFRKDKGTMPTSVTYKSVSLALVVHFPAADGQLLRRWAWMGLSLAELWKFSIEPRSPAAYFSTNPKPHDSNPLMAQEWFSIKKSYEDMKNRIETTTRLGRVSEEIRKEHKGFQEWNHVSTQYNHQSIVQILIDGREGKTVDVEGQSLPTLVYLSREKRPQYHHNFKAGAMNSLIRVSSKISNGSIILNVDCDMYSNNSESVRDALCFFMDEQKGHEIAYVQFPPSYNNLTTNDLYGTCFRVLNEECEREWKRETDRTARESASVLEASCKVLASCSYEENTQWGKEMGLKYGCSVEDIITGLSIQCRGWKSISFSPERKGFVGVAPTTLLQSLIQHKRWSEGNFQIFLSRYCPLLC
ncbi:Cellulose synthase-like protein E6 [Vitis vinifera]|uniref:Cellulose synthase-like protein E6 n=1 Tax=Vitis vinifera TaxID=29760 RepID=A0A438HRY5_VITVI|nr:Cellulose synthase-like protein E6 [Vitis vinifera]